MSIQAVDLTLSLAARYEAAIAPEEGRVSMEHVLEQAEAVVRFSNDLQRRMSEVGVEGIDGVIQLYAQLQHALERVSHDELDWAAAEIARVVERLGKIGEDLRRLKALKLSLESGH